MARRYRRRRAKLVANTRGLKVLAAGVHRAIRKSRRVARRTYRRKVRRRGRRRRY